MVDDLGKSAKDIEADLAEAERQSAELEKKLKDAEAKRPAPPDHADDGGVI
jgi:F0F1-type ATP synthase membrane subunit b/b'